MKVPCTFECRDIYCHSKCEKYLEYRKLKDECNKAREKDWEFINYSLESKARMGLGRRI